MQPGNTTPKAQVPGYRVAGKRARRTSSGARLRQHVCIVVCRFAPASAPRLIVAVMIDEPSTGVYYGGEVAAPVFSSVMGSALRMLGVRDAAQQRDPAGGRRRGSRGNVMATVLAAGFDAAALVARLSMARGITADSGWYCPGDIFAAYRGKVADGRAFCRMRSRGAPTRCCGTRSAFAGIRSGTSPNVAVDDLGTKLGAIADHLQESVAFVVGRRGHGNEWQDLVLALDRAVSRSFGRRAGVIGTGQRSRGRAARVDTRRMRRSSMRRSPRCATRVPARSQWRSRRTRSIRGA